MRLKFRILAGFIALSSALLCLRILKSAAKAETAPVPIVLTVMGKVADSKDSAEQKAFLDFGLQTGIQFKFAESLQSANERTALLLGLFRNQSREPDMIDLDVIWTATLGEYLVDLKPLFQDEIPAFPPELLRNYTVNGRLVALPTFIDAGVLYYRTDLLRKYGFAAPPATWEELDTMATRIQTGERSAGNHDFWGYLWQGGPYESLTCNALEWASSSGGGEILGADRTVRVRNPQFLHALERAVSWIGRISPPGQSAFGETDGVNFWQAGKAAFMRNWTGEFAGILHSGSPVHNVTGLTVMPGGIGGRRGTLGGAGTGISKFSAHPRQALLALKAIVSEAAQKDRAERGGYIPSRTALRGRPELMARTALHENVANEVIRNLVARPALQAGPSYSRVSRAYALAVHSVLARKVKPAEGMARLEAELVKITGFQAAPW